MAKFNLNQLLNEKSLSGVEEEPARRKQFYKVIPLSVYDLVPSKDNFYSTEQIEELKMSIEMFGVKQNLTVKPIGGGKYRIIAGHRRRLAALALVEEGKTEFEYVPCGIETEEDEIKERLLLITTNSTARQLSDWEKIKQAEEMRALLEELRKREKLPGRMRELIAEALKTSPAQIGRMEAISKNLTPEFKEELKEGRVNISAAYELSGLPKEQQKEAFKEYKEKGTISIKEAKAMKQEAEQPKNNSCPMNKDIPLTEAEVKRFCKDGCSPSCNEELAELLQKKAEKQDKNKQFLPSVSTHEKEKENEQERDKQEGLKIKYNVTKVSDGSPVYGCFVLRPDRDPAAIAAIYAYAEATPNKTLAEDLRRWMEELKERRVNNAPNIKRRGYEEGSGSMEVYSNDN